MPAKHSAVALRTEFPLYSIQCFGGQHMVVAGGGGAAKTGIPNVIETFEVTHIDPYRCECEGLNRTITDDVIHDMREAVMNGSICTWKIKDRAAFFAAGMNNRCVIFEVYKEPNKLAKYVGAVTVSEKGYQTAVCWAHDNSLVVTADNTGSLKVWAFPGLKKVHDLQAHTSDIEWLTSSPNSKHVVTCGRDGSMKHIDVEKGTITTDLFWTSDEALLKTYRCRACSYALVNHGQQNVKLFSVHIPKVMKNKTRLPMYLVKWDSRLLPERRALLSDKDTPSCICVSKDGNFIGIGSLEGHISIYIAFSLKCAKRVDNAHSSFVTGLSFAPVSFCEQPGQVMQSRLFVDFDAVLLSISIDKQVNCTMLPVRTSLSVATALMLCCLVIVLIGVGIAIGSNL